MPESPGSRKITPRLRAELEVAAAIAREHLLEAHVAHLLELVHTVGRQIAPPRTIEIYVRLHSLDPDTARMIGSKTLATLGEQREAAGALLLDKTHAGTEGWGPPLSLFGRIRKRLRGRVNPELRQKVELHTGRTQIALLQVHVNNALRFVKILTPGIPIARAVELYAELIGVRRSVAEIIYFLALDRLSNPPFVWPEREPVRIAPAPAAAGAVEQMVRLAHAPR